MKQKTLLKPLSLDIELLVNGEKYKGEVKKI